MEWEKTEDQKEEVLKQWQGKERDSQSDYRLEKALESSGTGQRTKRLSCTNMFSFLIKVQKQLNGKRVMFPTNIAVAHLKVLLPQT